MKKLTTSFIFVGGLLLSACASQTGWTPTVDPYNDRNAGRIDQDMAECKDLAGQAGGTLKESAIGAGVGGLIGAAGGAAVGALTGHSPGRSAALGAAVGGIGGGAKQGMDAEGQYKRAYSNCMRNRGHNIVN